jgi:catechol 2,3-dioxygenase-like lactoylglutathione lyase family enzyme
MSEIYLTRKPASKTLNRRGFLGCALAVSVPVLGEAGAVSARPVKAAGNSVLGGSCGLHHTAIWTRDWRRTLEFYRKWLGFSLKMGWDTAPRRSAYLDGGDGTCIEVFERLAFVPTFSNSTPNTWPDLPANGPAFSHVYLRTDRLDIACEHARAAGARVPVEPQQFTLDTTTGQGARPVRLCLLEGPSDEQIELLQNAS